MREIETIEEAKAALAAGEVLVGQRMEPYRAMDVRVSPPDPEWEAGEGDEPGFDILCPEDGWCGVDFLWVEEPGDDSSGYVDFPFETPLHMGPVHADDDGGYALAVYASEGGGYDVVRLDFGAGDPFNGTPVRSFASLGEAKGFADTATPEQAAQYN